MSNYNPETGPIPLTEANIAEKKRNFTGGNGYIAADGWFNRYGVFTVFNRNVQDHPMEIAETGLPFNHGQLWWSEKLLNLSRRNWRLFINNEGLVDVTSKKTGRLRFQIQPEDIRYMNSVSSGWCWVGKSQYLLRFPKREQKTDMMLLAADQGKRPDYFDNSPFIKVLDPQYIGRRVMNLRFVGSLNENIKGVRDEGIVIDPRTKQLIARRFEYPLSYERWGSKFVPVYGHSPERPSI